MVGMVHSGLTASIPGGDEAGGAGHTPGSWEVVRINERGQQTPDGESWWVYAGNGNGWVGDSYMSALLGSENGAESNARLIAAAPELLAVASSPTVHLVEGDEATVRLRIGGVEVCAFKQGDWRATALILFDAEQRAAIAKATGTSTLDGYEAEGEVNQSSLPPQSEGAR